MQNLFGWVLLLFGSFLYLAQVISVISFSFAQKIGIQENPEYAAPLLQRAERYTAYWDLLTLPWLPLSGFLMIINHQIWPLLSIISGAIYFDAAGREAAKILSFRHENIATGTVRQQWLFFISYILMAAIGLAAILYSLVELLPAS